MYHDKSTIQEENLQRVKIDNVAKLKWYPAFKVV